MARRAGRVWLVSDKKAAGRRPVDYEAAVEEALCFGRIDSEGGRVGDERSTLWMAPRNPGAGWPRPDPQRIERLTAEGRMMPPGQAEIDAAKADGAWTMLDASEALEVPADLERALAVYPDAARHFHALPASARTMILPWIGVAKKPETRAARIARTASLANENRRAVERQPGARRRPPSGRTAACRSARRSCGAGGGAAADVHAGQASQSAPPRATAAPMA